MPKTTIQSEINGIVRLFVPGEVPVECKINSQTFGTGSESAISALGENVVCFEEALKRLREAHPLGESLSLKELLDRLIPLVKEKVLAGGEFTHEEAKGFEDEITNLPLYRFQVIRRFFGVVLEPGSSSMNFGNFNVGFGNQLLGDTARAPLISITLKPEELNEVYIECTVEARDTERAKEIANARFYSFEQIFRVFIGRRTDRLEVGILNYTGPQLRDCLVFAEEEGPMTHNLSWNGALQPIPLNDPYFSKPEVPFPRLFGLISSENTELERHVLRCAEWTGQAMGDQNGASAFVKGTIALEVLFSANEKGVITPSIMAQIAESCAFLLGNSKWQPWEVEKEMKRLYGIRSAVVHSGKNSVAEKDLNALLQICRSVVIILLSNQDFAETTSISQLADYFRRRKYAGMVETQTRETGS